MYNIILKDHATMLYAKMKINKQIRPDNDLTTKSDLYNIFTWNL